MKIENIKINEDFICFKTSGCCMEPLITNGNLVLVKLFKRDEDLKKGDIVVYKTKFSKKPFAHWLIKKIVKKERSIYITRNNYFGLKSHEVTMNEIIGKVVAVVQNNKVKALNRKISYPQFYSIGKLQKTLRFIFPR